jgi:hypothetical protein
LQQKRNYNGKNKFFIAAEPENGFGHASAVKRMEKLRTGKDDKAGGSRMFDSSFFNEMNILFFW